MHSDAQIRDILRRTRVIAIVGVSPDPVRPSHYVGRYLSRRGYRVIPVNPGHAGTELFGETVRATLAECPPETDMLDIFRRSEAVGPIVTEALARLPALRTVWMQIGVINDTARAEAEARGRDVVMDRCPKIEHQRLFGELRKGGFATGVISSRL
ncbi:CoA-binding protein [Rhodobaculum claviforme]|uniref:CoA-binding protein n=1 Tax=Rhodobaculum claviforme TaxID=1549854 RepID=A0A934TMQ0_9RHOB|nr:CoA-binding protein [Rhodobaculum claviforme]MBK5927858.1 CoA-binding protein [Rhodobaculum claviforme]